MFGIKERLRERGVTIDSMVSSAMLLYVPHGLGAEEAAHRVREKILKYLEDPNVASLLLGA
ncbi:MAG: phosphatidylglycerophosphatase A, partial [Methanoregulaceae archaeon]|nr:phosphatidylglycerophosphatase A [Methanoregulaceae archaeon]